MSDDFAEMLSALSAAGADYLVVGAYAVGAHSVPRSTGDLDIWVRPTPTNAANVWRALLEFGAPLHDLTPEDLARPDTVFQIGVAPRRIDILTALTGVTFDEAWRSRVEVTIAGQRVSVIGPRELIRNKRALGRPRDLADADLLERMLGSA